MNKEYSREEAMKTIARVNKKYNKSTEEQCYDLYEKISDAFNSQSGGDYHDVMYWQEQGAKCDIYDAREDGNWEDILPNLTQCWKFVEVCRKRDKLMQRPDWDNMPDAIYG